MNRYKSRIHMLKQAIQFGHDEIERREMDEDYQMWLPHEVYIHVSAFIFGIVLGIMLTLISFAGYYLFWVI